jgi:calpain-15
MLYKGKWMTIDIDEMIPFRNKVPIFSKPKNNELWVILLEKAWAKLYSSYKRIVSGHALETLHDLTGAPINYVTFKKADNQHKEEQWNYLIKATQL